MKTFLLPALAALVVSLAGCTAGDSLPKGSEVRILKRDGHTEDCGQVARFDFAYDHWGFNTGLNPRLRLIGERNLHTVPQSEIAEVHIILPQGEESE